MHRQAGNEEGESDALGNLGGVALLLGRYAEAADDYEQSLAISTRLDAQQSMALDLINLGLARTGIGERETGRVHLERARTVAHAAGLLREEADATRDMSDWLAGAGRYDEARKTLDSAIAAYTKAGLPREAVDAKNALGILDLDTGDLAGAAAAFDHASAEAAHLQYHTGRLQAELAMAELELRRHNLDAAAKRAEASRRIAADVHDDVSTSAALTWLSRAQQAAGNSVDAMSAARSALDASLKTAAPAVIGNARVVLGDSLVATGHASDAAVQYGTVLADAACTALPDLAWRAAFGQGRALEAEGHQEQALAAYLHSVEIIEEVRRQLTTERARTGFLDDKRDAYGALVRLLLRMGRTREAFQAAERLRAQGFRELVQRSIALGTSATGTIPATLLARIRQLQSAIGSELDRPAGEQRGQALAVYQTELREAEEAWSGAVSTLMRQTPWSAALRPDRQTSITTVQRHLRVGSALIEYVVGQDQTAVFVLSGDSVHAQMLQVGETALRTRIELLRGLLKRQETSGWQELAERLDADLLAPLRQAGWLRGISRLYVVPHAELNYLPFAVLRHESPTGVRLLIDDMSLVVLPAAAALAESRVRPAPARSLLALAPARSGLRFARQEVESLEALFPDSRSVLVGTTATESRFKQDARQYRVLHLATHGFFNRVDPLFSGVELEPDARDDGQLQVFEILGLPLSADLVTLSACDTALGGGELSDLPAGEELIGLTRAFLSAGSRDVLATLWEIDDRMTAPFMTDFYRAARTMPFPEALAFVQRERAHQAGSESHPWHWAAFTIAEGHHPAAEAGALRP